MIEQAKFAYSPWGKFFKKQAKAIEEQGKKQVKALEVLKPKEDKKEKVKSVKEFFQKGWELMKLKNEIDEVKKWEEKNKQKDLVCKINRYKYDFQQYETIRFFSDSIYNGKISIDEAVIDQRSLLDGLKDFNDSSRPKTASRKHPKTC